MIENTKECYVCFEEFAELVTLSCKHEMCSKCYIKVIEIIGKCPVCEAEFKKKANFVEMNGRQESETPFCDKKCLCFLGLFATGMICVMFQWEKNP